MDEETFSAEALRTIGELVVTNRLLSQERAALVAENQQLQAQIVGIADPFAEHSREPSHDA